MNVSMKDVAEGLHLPPTFEITAESTQGRSLMFALLGTVLRDLLNILPSTSITWSTISRNGTVVPSVDASIGNFPLWQYIGKLFTI